MKSNNISLISLGLSRHSRRQFLRKAIYASPVLLTLPATPSFAQQGSEGSAGSGDPQPPMGDPTGPRPVSDIDCGMPLTPINSDIAVNMCELSFDANSGEVFVEDIIVDPDAVQGRLALGNLLGTCDSFFCNRS